MHPTEGLHLYKQNDQTGQQGLISKTEPVSLSAGPKDTPQPSGHQKQLAKPDFEKAADTAEVQYIPGIVVMDGACMRFMHGF